MEQQIRRFYIPVHDSFRVHYRKPLKHHTHKLAYLIESKRSGHFLRHQLFEVSLTERIHYVNVRLTNEDLLHRYNIIVLQSAQGFYFSDEFSRNAVFSLANFDAL